MYSETRCRVVENTKMYRFRMGATIHVVEIGFLIPVKFDKKQLKFGANNCLVEVGFRIQGN